MKNPLDAKRIRYPCNYCDKNDECETKRCPQWVDWFEAKWREVTAVLRRKE